MPNGRALYVDKRLPRLAMITYLTSLLWYNKILLQIKRPLFYLSIGLR